MQGHTELPHSLIGSAYPTSVGVHTRLCPCRCCTGPAMRGPGSKTSHSPSPPAGMHRIPLILAAIHTRLSVLSVSLLPLHRPHALAMRGPGSEAVSGRVKPTAAASTGSSPTTAGAAAAATSVAAAAAAAAGASSEAVAKGAEGARSKFAFPTPKQATKQAAKPAPLVRGFAGGVGGGEHRGA